MRHILRRRTFSIRTIDVRFFRVVRAVRKVHGTMFPRTRSDTRRSGNADAQFGRYGRRGRTYQAVGGTVDFGVHIPVHHARVGRVRRAAATRGCGFRYRFQCTEGLEILGNRVVEVGVLRSYGVR